MTAALQTGFAFLLAWLPVPLAHAQSGSGVGILGKMTREMTLEPGGKGQGEIIVVNETDKQQDVRVYQTDHRNSAEGETWYDEPGTQPRSNAAWISFTPQTLSLAPHTKATLSFSLLVPEDDKLVGTYWSCIMVEPQALAPRPVKDETGTVTVNVTTVFRFATAVITHIGDTGTCELKFVSKQLLNTDDGKRILQVDVQNVGERALRPTVWVEIYAADGTSVGRFDSRQGRVFPGCTSRFRTDLTAVAAGKYEALVIADNGDENVFGARYSLEIQ